MKQQLKAGTYLGMMYYFFLVLSGAVLAWAFYLFSYMARFECAVKEALKNRFYDACKSWLVHFAGCSIFIHTVLVQGHAMAGCAVSGRFWMYKNYCLERVFKKYMTPEDIAKELEVNRTYAS